MLQQTAVLVLRMDFSHRQRSRWIRTGVAGNRPQAEGDDSR
jgi:hypothetical protein